MPSPLSPNTGLQILAQLQSLLNGSMNILLGISYVINSYYVSSFMFVFKIITSHKCRL